LTIKKQTPMILDKIDTIKSKAKGRLMRKTWFIEPILDFLIYGIIIGFFPFFSGLYFIDCLKNSGNLFTATILFLIALILCGLLTYSILTLDRLKRIQGTFKEQNRETIKEIVEQLGWSIQNHNQQITVIRPPWSIFSANWGRQVVIIYDKGDILINCTTYGLHDIKSPFHWFGNRKLVRQLLDGFEQKTKSSQIDFDSTARQSQNERE